MKNILTLLIIFSIIVMAHGQHSQTLNELTVDSIHARNDSIYLPKEVSINGKRAVNQEDLDTTYAAMGASVSLSQYQVAIGNAIANSITGSNNFKNLPDSVIILIPLKINDTLFAYGGIVVRDMYTNNDTMYIKTSLDTALTIVADDYLGLVYFNVSQFQDMFVVSNERYSLGSSPTEDMFAIAKSILGTPGSLSYYNFDTNIEAVFQIIGASGLSYQIDNTSDNHRSRILIDDNYWDIITGISTGDRQQWRFSGDSLTIFYQNASKTFYWNPDSFQVPTLVIGDSKLYPDSTHIRTAASKWHRVDSINTNAVSTWTNVKFDTNIVDETTYGITILDDSTGFNYLSPGLWEISGCGHASMTTGTGTVEVGIRVTVNGVEARCLQSNWTRTNGTGDQFVIHYSGDVRVDSGDIIRVQWYVDNTNMDFEGPDIFDSPIAFSFHTFKKSR